MLDNILNTVKRGAERVQRRGEEVAHATRLRMEVFQLSRELDGLYARLGRAYHAGADVEVLGGVREDIRRVEEEIRARERLITELGADPEQDMPGPATDTGLVSAATPANAPAPRTEPTVPAAVPHPTPEVRMTKDTDTPATVPTTPDPTVQHSDENLPLGDQTASMGNEAARDQMARHDNMIEEGKAASRNPDPLDK
ncbi:hypothetical protein GCM10008959_11320 [Deinococcus seoulensis]|uniref:Uncharacterized protein n=1 Tax=Deinococcus seoulensis TaxID=1837379 RepID=A0ABQ2RS81_9DEIO|nr:hypothetical protein [Deinococcus seoulensis]GGR51760.1 hypothetical protein GCM10008959_11320 [Deinococcus seoulensis]